MNNTTNQNPTAKNLADLEEIKKEALKRLQKRQNEFEFVSGLDKNALNRYLVGADAEQMLKTIAQENEAAQENVKAELYINPQNIDPEWWDSVSIRGDPAHEKKRSYIKLKDKFNDPIPAARQQELLAHLKIGKERMIIPNTDEEHEKLAEKYYTSYGKFLQNQRKCEDERLKRNEMMGDLNEYREILSQEMDINQPTRWNWNISRPEENMKIEELLKKKLRALTDKSLEFEFEWEADLVNTVDKFLDSKFEKVNTDRLEEARQQGIFNLKL